MKKITPLILERINKFSDINTMVVEGELAYFFERPRYSSEKLVWKKSDSKTTKRHIDRMIELFQNADFTSAESLKPAIWDYAEGEGRGDVLWPLRFALSGRDKSPDPFTIASILGKEETRERLRAASVKLGE